MSKDHLENQSVSYKDSLNLPQTDFPIRPDHKTDDVKMLQRWQVEDLASKAMKQNVGASKFILHDGPPYANGHIHLGHAYNKILKDIITKSQRMSGKHVLVTPGWDCHGLPIELKVTAENPGVSGEELVRACRAYATKWIDVQRTEFQQLGVLMDWSNPYLTMSAAYEASIVRAFGEFVTQGVIEKKNKTVPWCASCETVLASAEIEYEERKDPSIYVLFPIVNAENVFASFKDLVGKQAGLLVWTTTPWTLPLNRAVVLKPHTTYVVLQDGETYFVVGKELVDNVCAQKGISKQVVAEISSDDLLGQQVQHPLVMNLQVPILCDDSVSLTDGTACVHSAPGCGPEDYEIGIKHGLEIFSPISSDGKYIVGIAPQALEGMSVVDGQIWVLKELANNGYLYHKTSLRHAYPHCWRCHKGLIFRATSQWFCNLAQNGLKEKALAALDQIEFIPQRSKNSLRGAIDSRLEWCLSRQRTWGVPIVAALCSSCGQSYTTAELIEKVAQGIVQRGIEYWREANLMALLPSGLACKKCGSTVFHKEQDILDVWFESGISHYAVLFNQDKAKNNFPADIYLEGRDQARGWFQSSVLSSMVLEKKPPMRTIGTHGFTVDAKGRKMSKSLGNVVAPQDLIDDMGTDGLRLWVASNDFASDPVVSPELLKNVKEVYRKIRNTLRFLISNLYDFDVNEETVDFEDLHLIDQYALFSLQQVSKKVQGNYEACKFTNVFHDLADYCAIDLSALYLDIIKDRLYVAAANSQSRRAAQTVCWYILSTLNKLTAPILSFTAEQVSDYYQPDKTESIHLQKFANVAGAWSELAARLNLSDNNNLMQWQAIWQRLFVMRDALLKAIEEQRAVGLIKHPLEVRLEIYLDITNLEILQLVNYVNDAGSLTGQNLAAFFKEFLIVSQVAIQADTTGLQATGVAGLFVSVVRAQGDKCPRCWKYGTSTHEHYLCQECLLIVKKAKH